MEVETAVQTADLGWRMLKSVSLITLVVCGAIWGWRKLREFV